MNVYLNELGYTKIPYLLSKKQICFKIEINNDFLNKFNDTPAIVFIDGNHHYNIVKQEVDILLPKLVENGIPAQQYWESFFEKHPEQRPKHIIYYDGTPTDAVKHLLMQQDIGDPDMVPPEGKLLGFDDNLVLNSTDEQVNIGKQEVIVTANKVIQRSFS